MISGDNQLVSFLNVVMWVFLFIRANLVWGVKLTDLETSGSYKVELKS